MLALKLICPFVWKFRLSIATYYIQYIIIYSICRKFRNSNYVRNSTISSKTISTELLSHQDPTDRILTIHNIDGNSSSKLYKFSYFLRSIYILNFTIVGFLMLRVLFNCILCQFRYFKYFNTSINIKSNTFLSSIFNRSSTSINRH